MTRLFAIVGDPIAQARSPEVFNRLFHERGVDAVMTPMLVRPNALAESLSGLRTVENLAGLIITVPHKAAAAQQLRSASPRVSAAKAANALRPCPGGWEGDLFDGEGFAKGMEAQGHTLEGARYALVGCGGAGTAIAFALLDRGVASLSVWDVNQDRAADLAERLRSVTFVEISIAPPDSRSDVAINATPLGMDENDPLPFSLDGLRSDAVVADAIMKPPRTKLLREALDRGQPIQEGRHMLDNQVEAIWSFFGLP